jgi:hypothetical protein
MSSFLRGLFYGLAALAGAVVLIFIGLATAFRIAHPPSGAHEAVFLRVISPTGFGLLLLLILAFAGGFTYGARHRGTPL